MNYQTLFVELGQRRYPIYIGKGLLNNLTVLQPHIAAKQVMIITNKTLQPLFLDLVKSQLQQYQCDFLVLPDGERYKDLATWSTIFDALLQAKHHRNTTLIALGGGVICDITGFAAACYQRGVNFIQIPTTLLAQVDASIGGKTAVNHPLGKNMIGAFHQPQCVLIDTATLATLPHREFYAGLAEIIKSALIRDLGFFQWLESHIVAILRQDEATLTEAIKRTCAIKAQVVAEDEKEQSGIRALLNLGHTFAHAIEQVFNYQGYLHGEAVAIGIILAAETSKRLGWISLDDYLRIEKLMTAAQLPTRLPPEIQYDKILQAMAIDKKWMNQQPKLVLLKSLGHAELIDNVDSELIAAVIKDNIAAQQIR
jgi:3-dehydroquinate synthase